MAPFPALTHGVTVEEGLYREFSHCSAFNLTGWPGAVVRAGTSPEGLASNVQVVARPWREDVALARASHIEKVFNGWRKPPI